MFDPSFTLDVSGLAKAAVIVERVAGRGMAESLNRAGLHVIIGSGSGEGAMQATPKASKSVIRAIPIRAVRAFVVRELRKSGRLRSVTGAQIDEMAKRERKRRMDASGYTAFIGWTPAAKAMGGTGARGRGKTKFDESQFRASEARHGSATKATERRLVATIVNTAPMAEELGYPALQRGIDNAAEDLLEYARKKLLKAGKEAGF